MRKNLEKLFFLNRISESAKIECQYENYITEYIPTYHDRQLFEIW